MKNYDFLVLGGGSAGFNSARLAVENGLKTAVIDGARELGGLCILKGCMPSKTLIYAAEIAQHSRHARLFGAPAGSGPMDMKRLHRRKKSIIGDFASYREKQLKSAKFDLIRQQAHFIDGHTVQLDDGTLLRSKYILIATGSKVALPPIPGLAEAKCWTSDDVLDLEILPASILVLGGGIVACELAQFLRRAGSRVVQIQRSKYILSGHSAQAATVVEQAMRDEGIELFTGTQIEKIEHRPRGFSVTFVHKGKRMVRRAEHCLNALGRAPNTGGLNLDAAGVAIRPNGQILTNRWQQTSQSHIYAAGDCSGPHEIVHVAIQQGELAARHAAKLRGLKSFDEGHLLTVVFTDPQLATIGHSQKNLESSGTEYFTADYPFDDHGRSILMEANYGYVKVFAAPKRGRILGAEIVGKDAGELIHAFSTPIVMRATVFDMLKAPWYHPTLAEIITYPLEDIAERIKTRKIR